MRIGTDRDNYIRLLIYHQKIAQGRYEPLPGRPVGYIEIAQSSKEYNPLVMIFVVSRYRKNEDFKRVLQQKGRKGKLSKYAQSLYNSCFKNW